MIGLAVASAVFLAGLQAGINAPRNAFRECLKATSAKAAAEKVGADGYEAYLQSACGAQLDAFKSASISFDVKNGVPRKEAVSSVEEMVNDWLGSNIENYKFRAGASAPAPPGQ